MLGAYFVQLGCEAGQKPPNLKFSMSQTSHVRSLRPPMGARASNWSLWRMPMMAAPPAPIENPTIARCVRWRVNATVPPFAMTAAWYVPNHGDSNCSAQV